MAAVLLPSKIKRQKIMDTAIQSNKTSRKRISDLLFILWAGGAALLSYSLVYMLRKPYTAAAFEDLEVFNMDYKVAVTIVQILGYVVSKFMGIKLISGVAAGRAFAVHLDVRGDGGTFVGILRVALGSL